LKTSPNILAWGLLLTLSLIWGSSFILIKRGLVVLSAGEVGALRIVAAGLFLLPFALRYIGRIRRNAWRYLLSVGFVGSLLPSFFFAIAQTQLASSITGVLNATTPIFTILLGTIFFNQHPRKATYLGILIGFVGTSILILSGAEGRLTFNYFAFFVVAATICYGTNLNLIKYYLADIRPLAITSISLALVMPIAAIYLFGFTGFTHKLLHQSGAMLSTFYIVLLGVLGTAIALILFNKLVKITDPVFTSSVTYLIPIVAVIWGLIDGEALYANQYLGMAAIILGVYIANRPSKTKNKIQQVVSNQTD
jgi:drug/metabolite transporter (DMT)-like permease